MATNFLKMLKPEANLAHNGFDLSQKHVFSSKPGQLIPVMCCETVPDDKFEIDLAALSRTNTMNTPAFIRGKFRWDFFFVPYVQLWHPFEQFITQRDDKHSTRQLSHAVCPNVQLSDVLLFIAYQLQYINAQDIDESPFMDVHGNYMVYDAVRLLDMLGYGDFRWLIKEMSTETNIPASVRQEIEAYQGKYVNIFRLAAYQHIFYDFYRNKYWDVDVSGGIEQSSYYGFGRDYISFFNFDDVACTGFYSSQIIDSVDANAIVQSATAAAKRFVGLLTMRYSQYKKDIFTSSLPSDQFGAVSTVDVAALGYLKFNEEQSSSVPSNVLRYFPVDNPSNSNAKAAAWTVNAFDVDGKWDIPSRFDVLSLRKAEALQAWKQNALRAGNMTDDAFRAHYGVSPYYYADNNVNYLGSYESSLEINTVQSTADTGGQNKIGALGANGTSVTKGNKIQFHAKDFGVIMCIEHYVPDVEYRSTMIDKANRLYEDFDFYTPEYQNIGLESLLNVDVDGRMDYVEPNAVLGKVPRYWQYKTAFDKCHGEFSYDGTFKPWVAPRYQSLVSRVGGSRPLSDFYVNRNFMDAVFGIQSDDFQSSDIFIHNVFFDVKAIRPMSVLGLPQF